MTTFAEATTSPSARNKPANIELAIQNPYDYNTIPRQDELQHWAKAALQNTEQNANDIMITLRIVDQQEGQQLNHEFRGKNYATNVLSFPFLTAAPSEHHALNDLLLDATDKVVDQQEHIATPFSEPHQFDDFDPALAVSDDDVLDFSANHSITYLGDLVICQPIMEQEALQQGKTLQHHWAHLLIHGLLHLQGYDHQTESEAEQMEQREITILEQLGFTNPYEPSSNNP
jgi:probable rRNA maturation factor